MRAEALPRLAGNFRVTSPQTTAYNCIAWSAEDTRRWWQPGGFWPIPSFPQDCGIGDLERAFRTLGYEPCDNGLLEAGFQKIALYGSTLTFTHAARQLPDGRWTSKLGKAEDIEHDSPDDVAGGLYGEVVGFMRRPLAIATS